MGQMFFNEKDFSNFVNFVTLKSQDLNKIIESLNATSPVNSSVAFHDIFMELVTFRFF